MSDRLKLRADRLIAEGKLADLGRLVQSVLATDPDDAEAQEALLAWGHETGHARRVLEQLASHAERSTSCSSVLRVVRIADALGDIASRERFLQLVTQRFPADPAVRVALIDAATDAGDLDAALARASELAADRPSGDSLSRLAAVQLKMGYAEEALRVNERAELASPGGPGIASASLFISQSTALWSNERRAARARRFGRRFGEPRSIVPGPPRSPIQGRRLRIGYVSADLREHAVTRFLVPVLEAHDRERFDVFTYGVVQKPDHVTQRIAAVTSYRGVAGRGPRSTAQRIAEDELDVLIELGGHTSSRLTVVTYRPAPVQATWLGYPDTTGLTSFDARLTDAIADPPGEADALHTEPLIRLPESAWCFDRPGTGRASPQPEKPVFAAFHALSKITDEVLGAWARILRAVPDSSIVVSLRTGRAEGAQRRVRAAIAAAGADPDRIAWRPWRLGLGDHLAGYDDMVAALDTFPYNGTTTTCDALSRAIPVVTLAGARHAARVGASLLKTVGAHELVASNIDEYVERAVRLATDATFRQAMSARIAEGYAASQLGHPDRFTRDLEATYRDLADQAERKGLTHGTRAVWTAPGRAIRISPSIDEPSTFIAIERGAPVEAEHMPTAVTPSDAFVDLLAPSELRALALARGIPDDDAAGHLPSAPIEVIGSTVARLAAAAEARGACVWARIDAARASALLSRVKVDNLVLIVPNDPTASRLALAQSSPLRVCVEHPVIRCLVPPRRTIDPYTAVLFFAGATAVERLVGRHGMVAERRIDPSSSVPRITPTTLEPLAELAFTQCLDLSKATAPHAFAFALASRETHRPLAERVALLDRASDIAVRAASDAKATVFAKLTAARLLADVGARAPAVDLVAPPDEPIADPVGRVEPFLPALARYEGIAPKPFGAWIEAQLIEATVKLSAPSSFFHPNAVGQLLVRFARLGFDDDEMDRRLGLLLARTDRLE